MRFSRAVAAGAILALAFSACTKVNTGAPRDAHSNRLVISEAEDPKNLDPVLASQSSVASLSAFMYLYAVLYDDKVRPIPVGVTEVPTIENGDVSRDGLTLRYKLRRGMKWSDGVDVTCRDYRFTWQAVMNPKNNTNATDGWRDIRDVDCSDPYVAVVHMKRVYAPFLQTLWGVNGNGPVLPEHALAKYNDDKGGFNTAPFQSAPLPSAGPYEFVSWERGNQIRMRPNPHWSLGGPKIGEVVYKIIPDQNTLATQVRTHEMDLAWNLQAVSYDELQGIPGVRLLHPTAYIFDHIDFNLRHPVTGDVQVRRALTYAIDRPTLLDKVRHGQGELADTFLVKSLYGAHIVNDDIMKYPYDPAKARALLEADGWHVGPGGIRMKNGKRLSFQLSTQTESIQGQSLLAQLQSYWHAIGAEALIKTYPTPLFFDNTANGILQGGKYDVATFAWVGAPDISQSQIYSGKNFAPHGQNNLFWNNPRATAAMIDADQTIDMKRRIADYKIVQAEFAKDDPSIILWFRKDVEAVTTALQNYAPTPVSTQPFWNTWQLSY